MCGGPPGPIRRLTGVGQHRDSGIVRGVSRGPIVAVTAVIVLVLAVAGWFQLRDRISHQGTAAARTCVEGGATLTVTADPDIAPVVRELATRYADTAPVVRDHCITVAVAEEPSTITANALVAAAGGRWGGATPAPALWIPQSGRSVAALPPGTVDGQPRSVAAAAIVIAAPTLVAQAMSLPPIGWQDLPRLQTDPESLTAGGLPHFGTLRLALPTAPGSEPTALAAEAVAAAVAGAGAGPVTAEEAESEPVTAALTTLGRTAAALPDPPATTIDALTSLAAQASPRGGALHAVPVTEQQLSTAVAGGAALREVVPTGATPVADHPAAVLATSWTDETLRRAAAEFGDYLRAPDQADTFVAAGFRVGDRTPAGSPAVAYPPIPTPLAPAVPAVTTALVDTVARPARPNVTTVLLDISGSTGAAEGARSRLANIAAALTAAVDDARDGANAGLWVYSQGLDGSRPYRTLVPTGPLTDTVGAGTRRQAVERELKALSPASATSTYPSIQAAYAAAVRGFVADRPNTVLLITDGPNDDTSVSARQLLRTIGDTSRSDRPVRIDVVTIGENSDADTLRALADLTGGTVTPVATSDGPALTDALAPVLR